MVKATDSAPPPAAAQTPEAGARQTSAGEAGTCELGAPETGAPAGQDVLLVQGLTADGAGLQVVRARDHRLEQGALRPLEHGKPIHGDVVRLRRRQEHPLLFDVDAVLPQAATEQGPAATRAAKGPPQVATARYRANWDEIWSRSSDREPVN